jgi:hypothetical protein
VPDAHTLVIKFVRACASSSATRRSPISASSSTGLLAFFSRPIVARYAKLVAYEREFIGLVHIERHWRPYLWGRLFLIKADHYSLNFLLDQRLSTNPQYQWASKLLGFDFHVEFEPSAVNVVVYALSRRDTEERWWPWHFPAPPSSCSTPCTRRWWPHRTCAHSETKLRLG